MHDCLIIGGGVIGLSIAYELTNRQRKVCVLDQSEPGRAASWAGAGMLPPASPLDPDPLGRFAAYSLECHQTWAKQLLEETGIDNGFRPTGAIYVATTPAAATELRKTAASAQSQHVEYRELSEQELRTLEPTLAAAEIQLAYHVPGECQIRNPRHLKALHAACVQRGVEIIPHTAVEGFVIDHDRILSVQTAGGEFTAKQFCLATGSWSEKLTSALGLHLPIKPIRGQIALLQSTPGTVNHIINEGPRYLVPREDGKILVGSTMEDVGFDTSTTPEAIEELVQFAQKLAPSLASAQLEQSWSGLRPASQDGLPFIGQIPHLKNAALAIGHTRGGLQLATATAVSVAQLLCNEALQLDLSPFHLDR